MQPRDDFGRGNSKFAVYAVTGAEILADIEG
jgi:hypothetical protein